MVHLDRIHEEVRVLNIKDEDLGYGISLIKV